MHYVRGFRGDTPRHRGNGLLLCVNIREAEDPLDDRFGGHPTTWGSNGFVLDLVQNRLLFRYFFPFSVVLRHGGNRPDLAEDSPSLGGRVGKKHRDRLWFGLSQIQLTH